METQKPLLKDKDGEEVDVHMYSSMIGSLMYLTSSRPDIMFAVCACARYQVNPKVSHLHVVKRIFRYLKGQSKLGLWYPKDSSFDLVAYTNSDYAEASLDRKSTTGVLLVILNTAEFLLLVILNTASSGLLSRPKTINGEAQLHAIVDGKKIIITESSVRRDLQLADEEDEAIHKELGDSLVRAATTASSVEAKQDNGGDPRCQETMGDTITQTRFDNVSKHSNDSLLARGNTVRSDEDRLKLDELMALFGLTAKVESSDDEESLGEDASKQGRIDAIDADEEITMVSAVGDKASAATTVSAATTTTTTTVDDITDKGKSIWIEPVKLMKKKDQISFDEETALKLQADFDEEERLRCLNIASKGKLHFEDLRTELWSAKKRSMEQSCVQDSTKKQKVEEEQRNIHIVGWKIQRKEEKAIIK
ncbi:hypothetical protein Tco_0302672 [Tanacetum coccineum]